MVVYEFACLMYRRSTVHLNGKKIFIFLDGKFRIGNKIKRIIRMLLLEEITVMKKFAGKCAHKRSEIMQLL